MYNIYKRGLVPWPMRGVRPCVLDLPALLNLVSLAVRSIAVYNIYRCTVNPVGCPIHWGTRNEGPFDGLGHSKGRDQKGIDVGPNRTGSDSDGFVGHLMAPRKRMARSDRGVFAIMTLGL